MLYPGVRFRKIVSDLNHAYCSEEDLSKFIFVLFSDGFVAVVVVVVVVACVYLHRCNYVRALLEFFYIISLFIIYFL